MKTSESILQATNPNIQNSEGLFFNEIFLIIALISFVILLFMEGFKPYRRFEHKVAKNSIATNTSAFLFNNLILTALRALSLFFIAQQFANVGILNTMQNGPVKWLLTFLLYDLTIYLWHFASHKYEFLWRIHKIHHSDKAFNVTTGFRFHIFDLFLEIILKCIFVIVIGVNAYLVLAIELLEMSFIFFHHSNLSFAQESIISRFIITSSLHRTHHSTLRSEHDSNYGIVLSIWDQLFGTRKEVVPKKIGLDLIEAENLIQLFFLAFLTEKQMKNLLHLIPRGKR
ncbi:fatty acid hydroxylase [Methyloprofundus sedimenti]|uniref:Fatty acid hydroxylase n=2 Tax=Methyloprofundus sedimenti TaxID=1420851 RepID=A0A1V8M441_9GAMM|nr:fatty acid hydroxylase [Methyloprofundus sedimenti]